MPDGDTRLAVEVVDARGHHVQVRGLAAWLRRVAPARARGSVNIALMSDARVRALNRTYRLKDTATDVLSFPEGGRGRIGGTGGTGGKGRTGRMAGTRPGFSIPPILPIQPIQPIPPEPRFLGDIVIARGVAKRQAREAGHSQLAELKVLALHGLLHLLGYDHERDNGRMRRVERRLRSKGGLRQSLIERAGA